MIKHQYSKHFAPDADESFKNEEFERGLMEFIEGFVQYYPHLIEKSIINDIEVWIFKFEING